MTASVSSTSGPTMWQRLKRPSAAWLIVPPLLLLTVFMFWPLLKLFSLSFLTSSGELTTAHFERILDRPVYVAVLKRTFELSAYVTFFCILLGYPVAYALTLMSERMREKVLLIVILPFWTGFLVRTFAWLLLLQNTGVINKTLMNWGIIDQPLPLIYNMFAVVLATVHILMPYAVLTMLSAMERIDRNLLNASRTMGASPFVSFVKVYFPISLGAVASSALMVFMMCLGFFVTPALLGGPQETVISQLIATQINQILNWNFGSALAVFLLVSTLVCYLIYARFFDLSTLAAGATAQPALPARDPGGRQLAWRQRLFAPVARLAERLLLLLDCILNVVPGRRLRYGLGKALLWMVAWAALLFLLLPILIVIPVSLTGADFLEFPPSSLSLRWYAAYFNDPLWIEATWRSVRVGIAAALLSTILGGMAALALSRSRLVGADLLTGFLLSPMILPRMVLAIAIFRIYSELGLVGTDLGLIIAHTTLGIPVAMIAVATALQNFDLRLEQAAATMGANRRTTLQKVTLPIVKTGVFSALLFSFVVSFDELILALFIAGGTGATLPRKMWDEIYLQVTPTLAAVSTLIILCVVVAGLTGQYLKNRRK